MAFATTAHGARWLTASSSPGFEFARLAALYADITAGVARGGASPADAATFESIARDVGRTFSPRAPAGSVERLRRVLTALAVYDRTVGYTQGLNFLAAFALLHVSREDEAFALVARLLNGPRYGMSALFRDDLRGVRAMAKVVDALLEREAPRVAAALARARVGSLFFFEWHFSLFTLILPAPLAADVWDVVFRDGFAPAAHRAVVALARALAPTLEAAPATHEALTVLKAYARARATAGDGLGGGEAAGEAGAAGGDGGGPAIAAPADLVARMCAEAGVTLDLIARLSAEAEAAVDAEDAGKRGRREPPPPAPPAAGAAALADAGGGAAAVVVGLALLTFGALVALRGRRLPRR